MLTMARLEGNTLMTRLGNYCTMQGYDSSSMIRLEYMSF